MNCLLTGGNGFLGKFIFEELKNEYKVYTLSRTSGDYLVSLDSEVPCFNEYFDIVVHCAGKAHLISKNKVDGNIFFQINNEGTKNLLNGLKKHIPKHFVFISSVSVYGRQCGSNINESNLLMATDPYGLSKIQAEQSVLEWCENNKVLCTILRLPLVVGENPPGNLRSMIRAIRSGYYFNIAGGSARKSMILAEDVAKFILRIAPIGGIYNLTDGVHPTVKELSKEIGKKDFFNVDLRLAKIGAKIGDLLGEKSPLNSKKLKKITLDLTFDDSKAREKGWSPRSVLDYLKSHNL
jgi:nucleoside-diphosphate-sugar epimerase